MIILKMKLCQSFKSLILLLCFPLGLLAQPQSDLSLKWDELPELPPLPGLSTQPGLAGAFSGVHNDALIIAGGANFPDARPWEGGAKVFWDNIFVMERALDGNYQWHVIEDTKLPQPLAYGVSVSTSEGLLCMGGSNENQVSDEVFLLKWDPIAKSVTVESLPSMPVPLAFMGGAQVNNKVYIAGGQETLDGSATKDFYAFDLTNFSWNTLEPWPGPARVLPVTASQSDGNRDCFFLFSGRETASGNKTNILSDAYRYDPALNQWFGLSPVSTGEGEPVSVMAGTAIASGANHILIFGGADGKLFSRLEDLEQQINTAKDSVTRNTAEKEKLEILNNHPGFSQTILSYHTLTDSWNNVGELPVGSQVTTNAFRWNNSIIIPSGEIMPGIRTPKVWKGEVKPEAVFGWVNYLVIGIYLVLLVGMGIFFSRRENTTDDYFKAGGRIPWWAAGLSIFGTQLSAITFMSIPAKAYATDWGYFMLNMTIIMVAPIVIFIFLPFYRRLNITTAYEYLEMRFNLLARLIGSLMLVVFQFGRIGIVLFLPSIAISVVTGIDVNICIILMGVLSILYTVLGGIEAVVWTDVLQVVVLLGGALLCLIIIPINLEGGWSDLMNIAVSDHKFHIFDFRFDWTTATFWVVLLGGLGSNLISYGSDQVVVQRYLTTKDEKSAANSIWIGAIMAVPATIIFFSLGTALYAFYHENPTLLDYTLENSDAILPHFIVYQLPQGVAGLLIAGIFAAAMSSLDSSMNSLATVITTDFYQRFQPDSSEHSRMQLAKWTTGVVGVAGTTFALFMATWDIKSLWDQLNTFIGLFAGGLGGLFLLGICTRKANGAGAVIGLVVSGVVQFVVKEYTSIHLLLYAATGTASCFIIGYLMSFIFPGSTKNIHGLTIYTLGKNKSDYEQYEISVTR